MAEVKKYLFGPVPSRRLGLSLGVDIIPMKTCTQNCVYCQLGQDGAQTLERKPYVPIEAVLGELRERIASGLRADYITLSGGGEPTLNSQINEIIEGIKEITTIPVALITNGTLFTDPAVRADCANADVVLPSLDAGDQATFARINCPHQQINFGSFVEGLCRFRAEYKGKIWLEVFFCEGINTSHREIEKIRAAVLLIGPDKIQLNTAIRPTVDKSVVRVNPDRLRAIATRLGPGAEIIADFSSTDGDNAEADWSNILDMLRRRPCTLGDICKGLALAENDVNRYLTHLAETGAIISETVDGVVFFKAK
ncbi:MAG: radical SAM protein [Planctomycetota bacterium]|jgi:wyosine [tRNA(Phe)-imidazoG37] synthetase (radical SAM superfamily)